MVSLSFPNYPESGVNVFFVLIVIAIALFVLGSAFRFKRSQTKSQQEYLAKIAKREAALLQQALEKLVYAEADHWRAQEWLLEYRRWLEPRGYQNSELGTRLEHVLQLYWSRDQRRQARDHLMAWVDQNNTAVDRLVNLHKAIKRLSDLPTDNCRAQVCDPFATTSEQLISTLRVVSDQVFAELVAVASHDEKAFEALQLFIQCLNKLIVSTGKRPYAYPPEWNEWVAKHEEPPSINSFVGLERYDDMPRGTVGLRLVRAVEAGNIVECAIVLAYCTARTECRQEVGDVLYADLTTKFSELKAKQHQASTKQEQA